MLIPISHLLGKPVKSLDSESNIGLVENILIDPENGKLLAFLVRTGFIFIKIKLLSPTDIAGLTPDFLVVHDSDSLILPEEIIKAKKVLDQKIFVLGSMVKTKRGKILGKCSDLWIESATNEVVKFYVKSTPLAGPLAEDRIIPIEKVIRITRSQIVVKDDVVKVKAFKKMPMRQKIPAKELAGATG